MRLRPLLTLALLLPLPACTAGAPVGSSPAPAVLLEESFEGENKNLYALNYTEFAQWEVVEGSVDLVGTPPFDDFLPRSQGMYIDLDGTSMAAGTLRSRERFTLQPGRYRLTFKMSGTPRPNQPPNTMVVSLGEAFRETITLESYAPLQTYMATFRVTFPTAAHLAFQHLGGDDYGIFIDDILFERR